MGVALNETLIAHAGTFSSSKRQMEHSFNLVTLERDRIQVEMRKFPSDETTPLADVAVPRKWGGSAEERIFQTREAGV